MRADRRLRAPFGRARRAAEDASARPDAPDRPKARAAGALRWRRRAAGEAPEPERAPAGQDEAARRAEEELKRARARIERDIGALASRRRGESAPAERARRGGRIARGDKWQRDDNVFNELSRAVNARARGTLHDIRFSMSTRISWNYTRILWETLVVALILLAVAYAAAALPQLEGISADAAGQIAQAARELPDGLGSLPEPERALEGEVGPRAQTRLIELRLGGAARAYARVSGIDGRVYYDDAPFELAGASVLSYWAGEFYRVDAFVVNANGHVYQAYVAVALTGWLRVCLWVLGAAALVDALRGLYFLTKCRAVNAQMLGPIGEISRTARALNAQNLSSRINVEGTRSELRELALVINEMLDRIEAAYDGQKQFVSDASHELRTPIAVIQGYANMLARWGKDDAAVRDEAIAAINSEAANMKELVEKLLFLARHDRQTLKFTPEMIDMRELTESTARETRLIAPDHEIALGEMQEVRVLGDGTALKQALRIFVDNACKYTPPGGKVTISCVKGGMGALISVEDTGCGIPSSELKRVFDRFYRVDGSRGAVPGHGLGLSIARIIALRHGGRIHVRSREGVGSVFTLELPGIS